MAPTGAACQTMIAACDKAGRKLMIAYRVHYEPYNRKMMEMSPAEALRPDPASSSPTRSRTSAAPGSGGWTRSCPAAARWWTSASTSLNATRYLTGEEPVEVAGDDLQQPETTSIRQGGESIAFQLRFPSGALANCTSSYGTGTVNRYRVMAAEGWYGLEPATKYRGLRMFRGHGETTEQMEMKGVNHFAARRWTTWPTAWRRTARPNTPGEEGLQDVKLIQQIYEAARTGKMIEV